MVVTSRLLRLDQKRERKLVSVSEGVEVLRIVSDCSGDATLLSIVAMFVSVLSHVTSGTISKGLGISSCAGILSTDPTVTVTSSRYTRFISVRFGRPKNNGTLRIRGSSRFKQPSWKNKELKLTLQSTQTYLVW